MRNKLATHSKTFGFNTGDTIQAVLFFASLGLTIWGVNIYRLTIIDTKYIVETIVAGIIVSFTILTFLVRSEYAKFWSFFIKAVIGGGFFYFGLLFLNQQFADKKLLTEDFLIIKTGTLARGGKGSCSQPFAIIDFYGTAKELIFYCDFSKVIKHSSKVNLTYSKGAFGFNVIKSLQLAN